MSCRQSPPPLSLARMVRSLRGHAAVTETKTNLLHEGAVGNAARHFPSL